jgi:hypothetical protein
MNKERLEWIINGLHWDTLTKWEKGFVHSCEDYFNKYGVLTKRQGEILERLYRTRLGSHCVLSIGKKEEQSIP